MVECWLVVLLFLFYIIFSLIFIIEYIEYYLLLIDDHAFESWRCHECCNLFAFSQKAHVPLGKLLRNCLSAILRNFSLLLFPRKNLCILTAPRVGAYGIHAELMRFLPNDL